ncbi:hypothetical protein JW848_03575 [Candidatus Bipolaricaulota bacterium]|nr:hypothetical protein [Candidatus Bipolaricaulota bacterium]
MNRLGQWILVLMLIAMIAVFGGLMFVLVGVQRDGIRIRVEGNVMLGSSYGEGPARVELVMSNPVQLIGAEEDGSLSAEIGILNCPDCGGVMVPSRWSPFSGELEWQCASCGLRLSGGQADRE